MRIQGAAGPAGSPTSTGIRRTGTSGFSIPEHDAGPTQTGSAAAPRTVGGIEELMALQGVDDPAERRRRSVVRGRHALDALEELKLAVLSGTLDGAALNRLKAAAVGLKDTSGDRNLDGVLAEIELRVEVELAKMQSAPPV
jgi:hypothetical protein